MRHNYIPCSASSSSTLRVFRMQNLMRLFLFALFATAAEAQRRRIVLPSMTLHSTNMSSKQRALQDVEQVCNDDGTVKAAGTIAPLISPEYQPVCTCSELNNFDSLAAFDPSQGFEIDVFNQLISDLQIDIDWNCDNQCSTCFPLGDCAVVDVTLVTAFEGIDASFTLVDLLSIDPNAGASQFLRGEQSTKICTEFTSGQTGTACIEDTVGVDFLDNPNVERPCSLTYNGVDCLSCTIDAEGCLIADCSNHGVSNVNTCTNTGVDTIFQILPFYSGAAIGGGLTVACGPVAQPSPTKAPASNALTPLPSPAPTIAPKATPTTAPDNLRMEPTDAPDPLPTSTPNEARMDPTNAPDPLPTPNPVEAPAAAPVTLPTTPTDATDQKPTSAPKVSATTPTPIPEKTAEQKGSDSEKELASGPAGASSPFSPVPESFSSESKPKPKKTKEVGTSNGSSKGGTNTGSSNERTKKKGKKV